MDATVLLDRNLANQASALHIGQAFHAIWIAAAETTVECPNSATPYASASKSTNGLITWLATGFTASSGATAANAAEMRLVRKTDKPDVPVGFLNMAVYDRAGNGVRKRITTTFLTAG
mmetsp:Transcript_26837/g.58873  ORF Transcript_26837/g.58873 Transcript_26837/m.58873 type:complete len:118 (-) Transcript_26837:2728-3081(-)